MKRMMIAVALLFAIAVPAGAVAPKGPKTAESQCRVEYNEAKRNAGRLKTHKERVDAKRDAKVKYKECLQNTKHKS